ncbi:DNA-binding transcription factor yap1 [Mucor velutinosus]|uniref:DNA-binding transcription factor yap1 n=1 Tax=Mucor velutinosus TaxID=708070 RepID=A0AAN7I0Z9_9FUNG|nr:DNA-binding transcription factor yap1 [Mucor velutinosus]
MKRALEQGSLHSTDQKNSKSSIASSAPIENHAADGVNWTNLRLNDLESNHVNQRIQCLLAIARQIPLFTVQQQKEIIEIIIHRLEKEQDGDAKAMMILLVEKCSRYPNVNTLAVLTRLLAELNTESTKVKWHVYNCIYHVSKNRQITQEANSATLVSTLYDHLTHDLTNSHHKVRAISISLLSLLPFVFSHHATMAEMQVQKIVSNYARDSDPRVRKSALDALVQMHLRGCPLDLAIYNLSVASLRDDYEEVRMGGLNLMGVLSSLYPEHRMKLAHEEVNETTRLIDDAFNKVCDLVNDSAITVRTKACVMMASYQHVGPDMLSQTFSKQIMSHLKRRLPRYKQQQKKYANGQIPVAEGDIDVESDEFHILDSGACGSFIHGLEDEFQEVRNAAIDSICELCMYNEQLTKKAVEFLVDMFNDDIDKIRLNAIQSLRKIGTKSTLEFDEEQLEIAVGALEDSDPLARQATHELFTVVRLTVPISLTTLLDALEANTKRYPMDVLSIYRCLRDVGKRHDDYVETLVPDLLRLDKRYLPKEANVEDTMYTAYVILIVNACSSNVKMLHHLPKYIFRHFAYFKSKYPDCIPDLRKLYKITGIKLEGDVDCLPMTFSASAKKLVADDAEGYMTATIDMLQVIKTQVERNELSTALLTIDVAIRNFKYITSLKPLLVGKSELAQLYLQCYQIVIKVKQSHSSPTYASTAQLAAASLLKHSYTIQHTYLGLSKDTLHAAMYFRILANMIWIFGILKQLPISNNNSFSVKNMLLAFRQRAKLIQQEFNFEDDAILSQLQQDLSSAIESPTTTKMTLLHSFITSFVPLDICLNNPVKRTTAEIILPQSNPDKPFKFASKYPVKLHLEVDVFNCSDTSQLAIEFILPDQSTFMFWPAPGHFKQTTPYCFKLATNVELNLSPWTEPGVVIVRIVQSFEPDLAGLDDYIITYPNHAAPTSNNNNNADTKKTTSCVISEHLKYRLCPTATSNMINKRSF